MNAEKKIGLIMPEITDPLDYELLEGVFEQARLIGCDVLIYTGYTLEELKGKRDPATDEILSRIAVLVDGPYVDERNEGRGLMGSSNQRIFIWKYPERYKDAETCERHVQFVGEEHSLLQIGVPPKDENTE